MLVDRLRSSLAKINRDLPAAAIEEAIRQLTNIDALLLLDRNHWILMKYGYPPDKQERATTLVLEQAALHAEQWVARPLVAKCVRANLNSPPAAG